VTFPSRFPALSGKRWPGRLRNLAVAMTDYDLVLTHSWDTIDAVLAHTLFQQALGLPPLVHHEEHVDADEGARRNWLRRIALGRTAALVVPSLRTEALALGAWQQPRGRVVRIAPGIKTRSYSRAANPGALAGLVKHRDEKWVGAMAPLESEEQLARLVRAMDGLPQEWQLVILGAGPEREAILDAAEQGESEHRVHLPGMVARTENVIGLFDIFARPADFGPAPVSVIEAMAAGLPLVASGAGDIGELVAEENLAFVTPPGDEQAFAEALAQLAHEGALRGPIGRANRVKAREQFDEKRMIERYRALYASLIGGNRL